jgi:sugar lactone lactonase YvrE
MRRWLLSYHSPDQALAEGLKALIERKDSGSRVFIAPTHLRTGGSWSRQLALARRSVGLLAFVSVCTWGQAIAASVEVGSVTTLAGKAGSSGNVDGTGSAALFLSPKAMSVDDDGNIYTVDNHCGTVRKITRKGAVTTVAGPVGTCAFGSADGTGAAALFNSPSGTTVDSKGNIFVADSGNCTLRKVNKAGVVTTVAGAPSDCVAVDGPKSVARFNYLAGVAVDKDDNVFVTGWNDCTVRKVTPAGNVTTIVGVSAVCGEKDGVGTNARLGNPSGIVMDKHGDFYFADETGCTVRKMTASGIVTTVAGNPGVCGSKDGVRSAAEFNVPSWTAVDQHGNIYVADYLNFTVRKVTTAGVVTTLAGLSGVSGSADGLGTVARFDHPDGIALVDGKTHVEVYVADRNNNAVRKIRIAK